MINPLSTFARAGVVSLALLTSITGSVSALPIGPSAPQAPIAVSESDAGAQVQLASDRRHWRRHGGGRNWNGNRHWRGNRNWHGNRNWNGNRYWRGRGGYYGNYGNYYGGNYGSGIYLGFGLPAYQYAEPYYYAPRYLAPRRAYRAGTSHVEWCYARYRSYRDWDNTFQPYNGPRQQCYSPYG